MSKVFTESEAAKHPADLPIRPIAYSIASAAKVMDVSESTITRAINAGEITISKFGTRVLIPVWSLEAWLRSKETRRTKATA